MGHDTGAEDAVHAVRDGDAVRRAIGVQHERRHTGNAGRAGRRRIDTLAAAASHRSANRNANADANSKRQREPER